MDGVLDKPSDKEVHHCDETEFVKHLLDNQEMKFIKMQKEKDDRIFELEQLLKAERKANMKKVDESCKVARDGMEGMLDAYVGLHPTMVSKVIEQLQEVAKATYVNTLAEIRGGEFFVSTMHKIDQAQCTSPDP